MFLLGTIVGSFLNVCILRLPWCKSVFWPGSHCPSCEKPIAWHDNIPIVSWVLLGGKCRNCRTGISPRYAVVELLTGVLFALLYWMEVEPHNQYVLGGPSPTAANLHWRYAYHLVLLSAMIVATFIDLDYQVIPDSVTVPGMIVGLTLGFAIGQVHLIPAWIVPVPFTPAQLYIPPWFGSHLHWHGLIASGLGFVVGGGIVWLVRIIGGAVLGKEAMGFGDVTLMAMIGSFIGWQPALMVFFIAPFVGMVVAIVQWLSRGDNLIPYGPYLSLATVWMLLAWKPIWQWISPVFSEGLIVPMVVLGCVGMLGVLLFAWRLIWWAAGFAVARPEAQDDDEDQDGFDSSGPTYESGPSGSAASGHPVPPGPKPSSPSDPDARDWRDSSPGLPGTGSDDSLQLRAGPAGNGRPHSRPNHRREFRTRRVIAARQRSIRNRRWRNRFGCSSGRCWCLRQVVVYDGKAAQTSTL
jgi:leader peptidase (prepilin peptidase)/N-methyltransferase